MLLADAMRSEGYRLLRNRMTVFWSVLFVPIGFIIGGVIYPLMSKSRGDEMAAQANIPMTASTEPVNLAEALSMGTDYSANGAILAFMLIAAATVYAGDYRWETWRLTSARNTRLNLLLGKVGVMKLTAIAASFLFIVSALVFGVSQAMVFQRPIGFELAGDEAGRMALTWLLGYVRIVQYGLVALLTAVVTRSLLAALFVPIALGFGQSIFGQMLPLLAWTPDMWAPQLLLPGLAFDTLKAAVTPNPMMPLADGQWIKALVGLALWCVIPLVAALAWFRRQDLSKE